MPGVAGDNRFYVFGISDAELAAIGASFTPQAIATMPEPSTVLLMPGGLGIAGLFAMRRRPSRNAHSAA